MSTLPAWKRALLEKKKQQEQQEEQKKQQEQEAYIKSLPPWKRAIVMREMEKKKATPSSGLVTGNAPTNPSPGKDKWLAALSQTSKPSPTAESSARSSVALGSPSLNVSRTSSLRTYQTKADESPQRSRPSWARTSTPNPKPALSSRSFSPGDAHKTPLVSSSFSPEDTPSPRSGRAVTRRGSVQSIADQFQKVSSTPPSLDTIQQEVKKEQPTQQASTPAQPPPAAVAPAAQAQVDDSDLAGLPSWKRALILKKRQKRAGIDAQSSQGELPNKQTSSTSSSMPAGHDEPDFAPQVEASSPKASPVSVHKKKNTSSKTAKKSRPEVVNRVENDDSSGVNKLVEKEGKTLHPPIFNEVNQWANVATDDPKFTQLPPWKQSLILRRRKDIAKRSGQETSPPDSPTTQSASEKRKTGSKKAPNKSATKSEGKKSSTKAKTKTEEKKTSTKSKAKEQPSKATKANSNQTNTKTNANSHSQAGRYGGSGGLRPVRPAPAKPPAKPPEKKIKEEEKEEPMFSWSFSKHSVETGDAMSNSSDSELEDVQVTSIDDELSDEDDSGIGGSGRTVLMSYKPLPESEEEKAENKTKFSTPDNSMSTSTSDPNINSMTRSDSKSILIDPSKKSYKGLRRVSFSDSNLHTEHFYPKYDYSDYEDIEQELPDIFGRSKLRNSGLSHRLHPSLRVDNDVDSDTYRYGFNSNSSNNLSSPPPSSGSPNPLSNGVEGGLSNYKPSMLSPFDSLSSLSSFNSPGYSAEPPPSPIEEEPHGETSNGPVDDNSADYYSSLNEDTAALLW